MSATGPAESGNIMHRWFHMHIFIRCWRSKLGYFKETVRVNKANSLLLLLVEVSCCGSESTVAYMCHVFVRPLLGIIG